MRHALKTWRRWLLMTRPLLPLALTVLLLTSYGCSSAPPVVVQTAPLDLAEPPQAAVIPDPVPIRTESFEWVVLNRDTGLPLDGPEVYYALTAEGYDSWVSLTADVVRWFTQAKWRLDYYRGALTK